MIVDQAERALGQITEPWFQIQLDDVIIVRHVVPRQVTWKP